SLRSSFFLEREDDIRAHLGTGVQTCALPISVRGQLYRLARTEAGGARRRGQGRGGPPAHAGARARMGPGEPAGAPGEEQGAGFEIGRAAWRDGEWSAPAWRGAAREDARTH